MNSIKPYLKALVGGLVGGISFAIPIVDDGLTPSEILGIALTALVGLGATYAVPNLPKTTAHDDRRQA